MQNHRNDLPTRIAFKVELRVDNLVKEPVFGACENWEGGLPCEPRFEMISIERNIEYAEIESVFADVIAEHGGVERDSLKFRRKLRHTQFRSRTIAILV